MVGVAMGCSARVEGRKRRRPVVAFSGRRVRPEEGKGRDDWVCLVVVTTVIAGMVVLQVRDEWKREKYSDGCGGPAVSGAGYVWPEMKKKEAADLGLGKRKERVEGKGGVVAGSSPE
ncbi:hypothetical protein HAX54_051176 [Datura stramonium]|uniref:Uncharacterized protein n=1 Tax=Datura stramonium TaxID=4076 RepID=A0ABS8WPY0_DATST|nr:hypothetical protein [Datura stramonium]